MSEKIVTAALIIIGDEILSGRTQDKNLAHLAIFLNDCGIRLQEVRVIPDVKEMIAETVNHCRAAFDYVFTTGGIGPTHDDITADSIAYAFDCDLHFHPDAMRAMEDHYGRDKFTDARKRMARVPEGATLIENEVSIAPGFQIENVFVLAGVPMVMQAMLPHLKHRLTGGKPVLSQTVVAFTGESNVAELLTDLQNRSPAVAIGSYPFFREGRLGTSLVVRSTDETAITKAIKGLQTSLKKHGVEFQ